MNALIKNLDWTIIKSGGKPVAAAIPFKDYLKLVDEDLSYPHGVAMKIAIENKSPVQAWREYLKISQGELARRMKMTQSAVSQMEKVGSKPQKTTLEKVAKAMKINPALLEDL